MTSPLIIVRWELESRGVPHDRGPSYTIKAVRFVVSQRIERKSHYSKKQVNGSFLNRRLTHY